MSFLLVLPSASIQSADDVDLEALTVAVAANFLAAAQYLGTQYSIENKENIEFVTGSTGVLTAQVTRGAPYDVLLAADRERPKQLIRQGYALANAECYARGALVLVGAESLSDLQALGKRRLAIASPRTAPYGRAALEVLQSLEVELPVEQILTGSNVNQAFRFQQSGNAAFALVAQSLDLQAVLVPENLYAPVLQFGVVVRSSDHPRRAKRFLRWLGDDPAQQQLASLGYRRCS
ncbi:MAG: molybdate ABC transporter substrate-binding protein [Pseudomonadota bacterium]